MFMRTIVIAIIVATLAWGCSKAPEQRIDLDTAPAGVSIEAGAGRTVCPECPEPVPCPQCESVDAVYYLVLSRVIRGETESFITRVYVHRGGSWYPVGGMSPDGAQPSDGETTEPFGHGDELLRKIHANPQRVGIIETGGGAYEQYGRVATSASSAPIDGVRNGQAHLMSFISVLR